MPLKPSLIGALLLTTAGLCLADSSPDSPTRLKWQCTEQPATRVVVNAQGDLASERQPADTDQPVQVHAIKLHTKISGSEIPARIISNAPQLNAPAASWLPGNAISTSDGQLRLDLVDTSLFQVTNQFGNQSLFRRYQCQTAGTDAPIHYQCGSDFDLWVRFIKDQSDSATSAQVQYPGGTIALPRAESGSGSRYATADTLLWIQGDSATFSLDGDQEHRCQVDD